MDAKPSYVKQEYPLSAVTGRIIAAAQEVHRTMGSGFEEVFYQRALALELGAQRVSYSREVWMDIWYKDRNIGHKRVDFIIEGVIVEIKAKASLEDAVIIQTISYLKASNFEVGLLLNFGAKSLQVKRLVNTKK